jgi:hypothetical protein
LPFLDWRGDRANLRNVLLWKLVLTYYGLAWLVGLIASRPSHHAFWLVFATALAISAPMIVLAPKMFAEGREGSAS